MKVLIVTKRAPFEGRGAEFVIWEIGKRFAEEGHHVRFLCPTPTTDRSPPDIDHVSFSFVDTGNNPTRSMIEFFLRGPLMYKNAYDQFEPDVVYDNPSPFPFHLAHVYGDAPVMTKVHAVYRRYALPCKNHPLVQVGTVAGEETYRLFRGETFVTNSESTAERLRSIVNTTRNKVVANPIGIDNSEFNYHVPDDSKQVVTVSKLSPRKRVSDLLRAWKRVERRHPDASLTVAGSGPLAESLRALSIDLGLENVQFHGFVSDERKRALLSNAAVYVSPTLYEGFGISVLEAMASGCAVVASDTWGVKDYLSDCENGRTVSPRNPPELAATICNLIESNDRSALARSGRETAKKYSMEVSLDREVEILSNL